MGKHNAYLDGDDHGSELADVELHHCKLGLICHGWVQVLQLRNSPSPSLDDVESSVVWLLERWDVSPIGSKGTVNWVPMTFICGRELSFLHEFNVLWIAKWICPWMELRMWRTYHINHILYSKPFIEVHLIRVLPICILNRPPSNPVLILEFLEIAWLLCSTVKQTLVDGLNQDCSGRFEVGK